jgi:hypothetical protein
MHQPPKPVLSRLQIGVGHGPEIYAPRSPGNLLKLYSEFCWQHHDICLFHQAIYREIIERHDISGEFIHDNHSALLVTPEDEMGAVMQSRIRETVNVFEMESDSIQAFGNQLLVVGLWAMVEQYCGRTLVETERSLNSHHTNSESPHKWHTLVKRFAKIGIDLPSCKSYIGIDECRVLNNKIKHLGHVDRELLRFDRFRDKLEKSIKGVPLELQYYSDSVYEFVGCVLEVSDALVNKQDSDRSSSV